MHANGGSKRDMPSVDANQDILVIQERERKKEEGSFVQVTHLLRSRVGAEVAASSREFCESIANMPKDNDNCVAQVGGKGCKPCDWVVVNPLLRSVGVRLAAQPLPSTSSTLTCSHPPRRIRRHGDSSLRQELWPHATFLPPRFSSDPPLSPSSTISSIISWFRLWFMIPGAFPHHLKSPTF